MPKKLIESPELLDERIKAFCDAVDGGSMGALIGLLLGGGQMAVQSGMNARSARLSAPAGAGAAADVQVGTDITEVQNAAQSGTGGVQAQVGADTATTTAQTQQRIEDILIGKPADKAGGKKSGTVVQVLKSKLPELSLMPSAARIDGTELPAQGNATSRAMEFLQKIGNKVTRSGFGDVLFSRSKLKSAFVGHGASAAKIETIAAVPAVIEHGAQVDHVENYEGRGYDTYMFAAPVTYRGSPVYLGVVVAKDAQSGRYYVHEAVDSDGNVLLKNAEPESASDRPSANAAAPVHSQTPLEPTVSHPAEAVNNEIHHGVGAAEAGFTQPGHETNQVPSRMQALTDNADFTDEARADAAQSVHDHYRLSNEQQRQMAEFRIDRDEAGNIVDLADQAKELLKKGTMHLPEKGGSARFKFGRWLRNRDKNLLFQRKNPGLKKPGNGIDAPGFSPDASIPLSFYVIPQHYRFSNPRPKNHDGRNNCSIFIPASLYPQPLRAAAICDLLSEPSSG